MNALFLKDENSLKEILIKLKKDECRKYIRSNLILKAMDCFLDYTDKFDDKQEKMFVEFSKFVDKKMCNRGSKSKNLGQKVPTIIAGGIYIGKFYDRIRDCDFLYLMNISRNASFYEIDDYLKVLDIITEEIFEVYKEFDIGYLGYPTLNNLVEKMKSEGKSDSEIIKFFKSKEYWELSEIDGQYVSDLTRKVGFKL